MRARIVHSPEYQLLISLLVEAREKNGLSQRQLSARLNKPINWVQRIEAGERELNPIELLFYVELLGVNFVDFASDLRTAIKTFQASNIDSNNFDLI